MKRPGPPIARLGPVGSGGFLRVLGIIYLIKIIRQRRRLGTEGGPAED